MPPAAAQSPPPGGPATGVGAARQPARAVQLNLAAQRTARRTRPGTIVLEDGDPGIPLSRVPYFLTDLRKLGLAVVLMILLLLAGSRLIPLVIR